MKVDIEAHAERLSSPSEYMGEALTIEQYQRILDDSIRNLNKMFAQMALYIPRR